MLFRSERTLPTGFVAPCLPTAAPRPPSGDQWLHEIKHDGFRIIARKDGKRVKLYSRPGNDMTARFPLIVEALARLRSHSCIIDGEAVACRDDGVASFDLIRHWHHADGAFLYAFDLIELNGDDLRRDPLIVRKATLASVLARAAPGLRLRPKRRDLRAGADQLWIELGINRLADAGTAANDALAASITAMRTSSLSTSTTHGLGELIAVVRECADAAATAGQLGRPHPPS